MSAKDKDQTQNSHTQLKQPTINEKWATTEPPP